MASIKVTCPKCKHQFYMEDYEKKACPRCGFVCCGPKSGSSGGCYLTTACVRAKGLPDNCAELQALRRLRDEFLMPTEFGRKAVAEYYETAPAIVEAIQACEEAHAVWEGVYREVAETASLVEVGDYDRAFERYQQLTRRLQVEYLCQHELPTIVSLTGDMPQAERSPANAGVQIECREGCRW